MRSLLAACLLFGEQAAPPETVADRMAKALLARHMSPLKDWLAASGVEPVSVDKEQWYALVVEPENRVRCPRVAIKFKLNYANDHLGEHAYTPDEPFYRWNEEPLDYAARIVKGIRADLWERMELAFTQEFLDPIETFTYGTSHFYRLPTEHSEIDKIRKEDLIY